ncbi:hypothetical protein GBA65_15385 [Rubrobacter marinus]|uniref:Carboxymuconolactone decarboxylase-like domain-containing protein n=1 Tax=Rubrobacter marinus TaxID=2653852 RepID=A0A6G8PZQ4_9ACTN|nr:hypothetical protein [Rubrobacter marinus]QIN79682.1 hypothetical protein GBA65_15385 [Rubrobacter marinus]
MRGSLREIRGAGIVGAVRDLRIEANAKLPQSHPAAMRRALGVMEHLLGDREFSVGDRATAADAAPYASPRLCPEAGYVLKDHPKARCWSRRLAGAGPREVSTPGEKRGPRAATSSARHRDASPVSPRLSCPCDQPYVGEGALNTEREGERPVSDWAPQGRISWFPVPDEGDLDPRVAEIVAKQREKLGEPNNVVRTHSWRPELMLRWLEFYEFISKGPSGLSRIEREMIGVVVSAENRCLF